MHNSNAPPLHTHTSRHRPTQTVCVLQSAPGHTATAAVLGLECPPLRVLLRRGLHDLRRLLRLLHWNQYFTEVSTSLRSHFTEVSTSQRSHFTEVSTSLRSHFTEVSTSLRSALL